MLVDVNPPNTVEIVEAYRGFPMDVLNSQIAGSDRQGKKEENCQLK